MSADLVMDILNGKDPHFNTNDLTPPLPITTTDPLAPRVKTETALFSLDEQLLTTALPGNSWQAPTSPQPLADWLTNCKFPGDPLSPGDRLDPSLFPRANERGSDPLWQQISSRLFGSQLTEEQVLAAKFVRDLTELPAAVTAATTKSLENIRDFFKRDDYLQELQLAYGNDLSADLVTKAIANIHSLPQIQVLSADILGKADGAFDGANDKIYLSTNLVSRGNTDEISAVIIEEIGHFLDRQFHGNLDAPGDEGAIFSKLVRNIAISNADYRDLIQEDDWAQISLNRQTIAVEQAVNTPIYALRAHGTVAFNGKSDLDGNPLDLTDDAFIYAEKGFTFNGNATLPVQRDPNGNALTNAQGQQLLLDQAVVVAAGAVVNVSNGNKYTNLNPPQVVAVQTFTIPTWTDLKQQELTRRIPAGTPTTTFNIATNPINTAAQWTQKFPPAGTATQPQVVRVTGGGLNIPTGVNLSNYVIIVDSGDLNFNGSGTLSNVMLIANGGNINLNAAQADNLTVLASGVINQNSSARFGGYSILANGTGDLTFNGATKGTTATDNLRVVSAGSITFNGAQSTRGSFAANGNFTTNGSSDIYGTIATGQNITFNGNSTFTYANVLDLTDNTPPAISAQLTADTGSSNSDKITKDSRINGTVTDVSQIAEFKAAFDAQTSYTNVLSYLQNGSFSFTAAQLEQIYGGTIPDGAHTLNLVAKDIYGNQSAVYSLTFTLDTNIVTPSFNLALASDTGVVGDYRTKAASVTLTGKTDINAQLLLSGNPTPITADAQGNFSYTSVALAAGNNSFTVTATDIAGNQKTFTQAIYRTSPPTGVSLSTPQILENSANNTQVGQLTTIDPDGADNYVYTLVDNAGGRFKLVGDKIQVANGSLLDFETNTQHQIQVRTTDGEGDSYLQTIAIAVLNVNETPTNLALSNTTIAENIPSGSIVGTFSTTDPDVGDTFTYSLVTGTGSTDNSKFAISSGNKLSIVSSPDFETQSSYSIRVRTTDAGGLSFEKVLTIAVTDVNEAPTNLVLSNSTTPENVAAGSVIGTFASVDPDANNTFAYTLIAGTGDTDNAAFSIVGNQLKINTSPDFETKSTYSIRVRTTDQGGLSYEKTFTISISDVNEAPTNLVLSNSTTPENVAAGSVIGTFTTSDPDPNNTFAYTLVTGTGNTDNAAFTIAGNQLKINSSPDFEAKNSYSIRVRTTDQGGLSYDKVLTIAVTNVNEAPTNLVLSNNTIAENSGANAIVGTLSCTDPDFGDTKTYTLTSGVGDVDNSAFTIVGDRLQLKSSADFETKSTYQLRVKVTDAGGLSTESALVVNILDVNEIPTNIIIDRANIDENVPTGTIVGNLSTTDPDAGDTFTYSLVTGTGDTDNSKFAIAGNKLSINQSPDFETQSNYSIRVKTTDRGGLSFEKVLTIGVNNLNEAPVNIALSNNTIAENSPIDTVIGNLTTQDPDLGDSHTYTLVSGVGAGDNSAFAIVGNQLKFTISPDFETKPIYNLRIRATDAGGLSVEKAFTVNITNVNEAPTQLVLDVSSVAENSPVGTLIGKFTTTDPDLGDTHTYSLITGTGSQDNGKFTITNNELHLNVVPDFETQSVYKLRVQTKDAGGLTWEQELTVNIIDLVENQAPTAIGLTNSSIAENSANNTLVAKLSTTDPDLTDTHTYTLLDNAGGRFKLVGDELRVADGSLLDFETATSHQIRIRTTDNGTPNLAYERNITINVRDVNEAPVFTSNPVLSANAGEPYSYLITTLDPDTGDTRQITFARPLPSWLNLVDNGNGTATLSGNPSASNTGLFNIALAVTDAAGLKSTQEFNLGVVTTLIEGTSFNKRLEIPIIVPATGAQLSFKLDPLQFDGTDLKGINDAFEVALVDAQGKSLVTPFQTDRDAFFNWTEGENVITGKGASYDAATKIVTLDLTGVKPGTAKLVFRLVNDDKDTTTSIRLTNLTLSPLSPLPLPLSPIPSTTTTTPTPVSPTFFNSATDVSPSILADYHRTSFNEGTKELNVNVALKNQGTYDLNGTLVVVVNHLSDPSISVKNADGFTPEGLPYYTFTTTNGKLDPTQVTGEKSLVFRNPNGVQFSYDLTVLSELNAAPVITSVPTLEVIAGQKYQYSVKATDLNGDSLTYKLLSSPSGMTIDPTTGVVNWDSGAIGNYQLSVGVSDGRGGVAQQDYTLAVTNTPPNRPPVFTTNPVVDAYINQLYKYDSTAVDPEGDNPISYSLVIGPNGMVVNPITGTVKWTAPPAVILGDTVLGTLRTPGESSKFSFGGIKGQRIYLDPLQFSGSEGQWRVDVISPSGNKIVNGATLGWYANQLLTLTENGNYQVVISGVGDTVGSFGFRTTDLGLVPVVPFDTVIKDRLDLGSADKVYRFTGNQGQKLYFDKLSQTGDLDWVIYDAANRVVATNYYFDDIEVDLPAAGEYILALRGRSPLTTPVDFSFSVVQPELTTTAISVNTIVSGSIIKKGSQSTYTFTGSAGQQLFYDAVNSDYLNYKLIDPTGKEIFVADSRYDRGPDNGLTLTTNGTYKVVVDGVGEGTGKYNFKLIDKASSPTIAFDTDVIGQFATLDSSNAYRFTLDTDRYIYFDAQAGNYPNRWLLYGGDGKNVVNSWIYDDTEFKVVAGDYFLVMEGNGSGDPNYKIRLVTPEFPTTAMSLNTVVSGSIVKAGEQDTYTFNGVAGQRLFYDALSGSSNFTRTLYDPSGRALSAYSGDSGYDIGPDYYTLNTTGTYKVVIDGNNNATGNYQFRLLDSSVAMPISLDTEIIGAIDQNNIGTTAYKFTATAGQHLYLNTGGGQFPNAWIVYGINGQYLGSGYIQDGGYYYYNNDDREFDITSTGEYLLYIQGNGAANTNYKFTLTDSQFTTSSLVIGNNVTGTIAKQGQQNTYNFSGVAGQELHFDILNRNGNNTAYLYNQSGTQIFARNLYDLDAADLIVLRETGNYRLVIDGNGATTDAYSFRLLDVKASATNISLDTDVTGQLTSGQETKFYQFTGSKGQRLYLDWLTSSPNTQWSLYDSAGPLLDNRGVSDYETTLTNNDTYTIAIRGYNDGVVDYSFRLITPDITTTPINLGTNANPNIIAGKIDEKGEIDTYTFSGTVGQKIYLDVINGGNYGNNYIKIFNQTGGEVLNRGLFSGDSDPIVLTTTGNYRVEIDGAGESTDNYQFSLLDLSQAINLSYDTLISGTLNNGASTQFYKFNGTAGQKLNFDSLTTGSNSIWTLYDNFGQIVMNDSLDRDREITFNYTGSYLLGIKGNSATPVNYQFQVTQLAAATPVVLTGTQIALNSNISGSITPATPNGSQSYTFTGTAGQKLFYDALGGPPFYFSLQDPSGKQVLNIPGWGQEYYSPYDLGPAEWLTLSMDGTYRLNVRSIGYYGDVKFQLLDLSSAPQISLDTDLQGTFTPDAAGSKAYRFNLTQGQHLSFDAQQGDGAWIVYKPNGQYLTSARLYEDRDLWLEAGEYFLVMQGYSSSPDYKFKLVNLSVGSIVNLDTDIQGTFSLPATDVQSYRFNVTQPQSLYFDAQQGDGAWYVYKQDGSLLTSGRLYEDRQIDVAPGEYQLAFQGYNSSRDYKLRIVTPEPTITTAISTNTIISGSISEKGVKNTYTFTGTAGQQLFYDGLGGYPLVTRFYDPTGKQLYVIGTQSDLGPDNGLTLTTNGTYTMVVDGNGEGTGSYQFQLLDKANAIPIAFDTDTVGQLTTVTSSNAYHFSLTSDRYIYFDAQAGNYPNRWLLYGGDGKNLINSWIYDDRELKLAAGDYFLIMEGDGSGDRNYTMRLSTPEFTTTAMSFNTVVTGSIVKAGEQDTYTFNGVAGQHLFYDALGGDGFNRTIYDPSGRVLPVYYYGNDSRNDVGPDYYTLNTTGRVSAPQKLLTTKQ